MKLFAILSLLIIATSTLAASPKRKRVFKIYTPEEIRRMEEDEAAAASNLDVNDEGRNLKKDEELSMSMPTYSPTAAWTKKPKKTKEPTDPPSTETSVPTMSPDISMSMSMAPTASPMRITRPPVVGTTSPPVALTMPSSSSPTTSSPVVEDVIVTTSSPTAETPATATPVPVPVPVDTETPTTAAPVGAEYVLTVGPSGSPIASPTPRGPTPGSGAMTLGTSFVGLLVMVCNMVFA